MEKIQFRKAKSDDLPRIIAMLADDILGAKREQNISPLPQSYVKAFQTIDSDPNQELMVVVLDGIVIGTFQLTFIQYLNYCGSSRMMIESVRISSEFRGRGLGEKVMQWTMNHARQRGVRMLQLTSDKQRPEAIKFYERLGFVASHEGFKLHFQ
ncbi:MAG: GNAT family N-acetyltransferase [Marinoscillum sp.]